jgi:23S rRNA (guanosine2251-2'-O)-methyltransferase
MSRLTRENCDFLIRIPIAPEVDSLNASVAAGIALERVGRVS